jgi:transposase
MRKPAVEHHGEEEAQRRNRAVDARRLHAGKLKNWRRIATRYDRHAQNYLSALALAAIISA